MNKKTEDKTGRSLLALLLAMAALVAFGRWQIADRSATEAAATALFEVGATQTAEWGGQIVIDKVLTNIHSVEVTVLATAPRQLRLEVAGEHPDGCDYPVLVAQRRRGNTIDIEVYR